MARDSSIEWTDHTFNPWWGCTKVSPACDHCYAEGLARRYGYSVWGPGTGIRVLSEQHWREPFRWNVAAQRAGVRQRVFCASMADVFEGKRDQAVLRTRLWRLIEQTPSLDWLLLTKRPGKVAKLVPWRDTWPPNVWIGTTVETQDWAEKRLPELCNLPAIVRFVSAEPLLEPIDLKPFLHGDHKIDWVIVGGESGASARQTDPAWLRQIRHQCRVSRVPFFFKQWGTWAPVNGQGGVDVPLVRVGKKKAGRLLDGRTWDEVPAPDVNDFFQTSDRSENLQAAGTS